MNISQIRNKILRDEKQAIQTFYISKNYKASCFKFTYFFIYNTKKNERLSVFLDGG